MQTSESKRVNNDNEKEHLLRLRLAQDVAGVASWIKNAQGEERFSSNIYKIFNVAKNETSPKPQSLNMRSLLTMLPENISIPIKELLTTITENRNPFDSKRDTLFIEINSRYLKIVFKNEETDSGRFIVGSFLDITESEKAKSELQEALQFNNAIFDSVPNAFYIFDLIKFENVFSTDHIAKMIGYTPEEVKEMGSSLLPSIIHKDDAPKTQAHLQRLLTISENSTLEVEYRIHHKDNKIIWVVSRDTVFKRDEQGNPLQILGVLYDITELKQKNSESIKKNEIINSILSVADNMICSVGPDMIVRLDNQGFAEYVGLLQGKKPKETLVGSNLLELLEDTSISVYLKKALENSRMLGEYSFVHSVEDSKNISSFFKVTVYVQRTKPGIENKENDKAIDSGASLSGYSISVSDITKSYLLEQSLIEAKEEAQRANKAKSAFLANMTHEVRTPLNAILGFSDLMKQVARKKEVLDYVESINQAGHNLLSIVNDVLDVSKLEAGRTQITKGNLYPKKVIDSSVLLFSLKAKNRNTLLNHISNIDDTFWLQTDATKFTQIINNLISNAVKFTQEGKVTVKSSVSISENILEIQVIDTGIGIPEEASKFIFEPFRQQDEKTTRVYGGTGLGLSIVKGYIELLGGTISLESSEGKGSTFSMNIPFDEYGYKQQSDKEKSTDDIPQFINIHDQGKSEALKRDTNSQFATDAEKKKFMLKVSGLLLNLEMDSIESLLSGMKETYKIRNDDPESEKERNNYFLNIANKLNKATTDFDIDTITLTLQELNNIYKKK
ncbi:MAG: hypothetical protein Kapaf2KO_03140 [Candidatus Kapaibacteriales bacterium]